MSRPRALVVEDDGDIRSVLCDLFDGEGYDAVCATNLDEARAQLAIEAPTVIILDLMLERESSIALLEELAHVEGAPAILLLSASREANAVGARFGVEVIAKPFDIDVLLARASNACRTHRASEVRAVVESPAEKAQRLA